MAPGAQRLPAAGDAAIDRAIDAACRAREGRDAVRDRFVALAHATPSKEPWLARLGVALACPSPGGRCDLSGEVRIPPAGLDDEMVWCGIERVTPMPWAGRVRALAQQACGWPA